MASPAFNFKEFAESWKGGIMVTQTVIDTWRAQLKEVGAKKFKSYLWDKNNKKTTVRYDIKSQTFYEPCTQSFIMSHDELSMYGGKFEGTSVWGKIFLGMHQEGVPDDVKARMMEDLAAARCQFRQIYISATKAPPKVPKYSPLGALFEAAFDTMNKHNMSEEMRQNLFDFIIQKLLGDD
jgi:hypothetical protein